MLTRDEALSLWDDLVSEKDCFMFARGEVVVTKYDGGYNRSGSLHQYGFFIRARNSFYTKDMMEAYNRVCERHNCTYIINTDKPEIIFFKNPN